MGHGAAMEAGTPVAGTGWKAECGWDSMAVKRIVHSKYTQLFREKQVLTYFFIKGEMRLCPLFCGSTTITAMKKLLLPVLLGALFLNQACDQAATTSKAPTATTPKPPHPAWILQGNIYEVNVRQYTPEGTLNAFAKHLDRLQKMGVQTLWFMPLNPISQRDRKGSLGSYYAVQDYTKLNPEYGTMADWERLVKDIHGRGMKVLIDWVPNHTGADSPWLTRHPDFFVKDKKGQPAVPFDWTDTRQLDYKNPEMQDSMIAAMRYWVDKTGIDGFRCDVAGRWPAATFSIAWNMCHGYTASKPLRGR
ncbi:MAG: hypothetical protein EOO56_29285 [Hymenobacter sp.]|nr:MAG: hypothetical protein EOO56_29285 [Hymenobacter sp.]